MRPIFSFLFILALIFNGCASTGPKVTPTQIQDIQERFNRKFFEASQQWIPRVYKVGYQLISSPVPGHKDKKAKYNFAGVGVSELKEYHRGVYALPKKLKGVLVMGTYPGSLADGLDIKTGDVVTHVNGKKIKSVGAYYGKIRKTNSKDVVLTIWRAGKSFKQTVGIEKVYYNAQFFLGATPNFDANSLFSKIVVGIGAIRYCRNEDELAFIMGHELAHTTLGHSGKQLGVGITSAVAFGAVAGVIDAFTVAGLGNLLTSPIQRATQASVTRRYEREADYFGMQHAFHSGYNVDRGARVFSRLATDAPGFQVLSQMFSSHPKTPERFLRLQAIVNEFQTQYPERFPMPNNPDWEIVIPVQAGESIYQAVENLMQESLKDQGGIHIPAPENTKVILTVNQVLKDFDFGLEEMLEAASRTSERDKASLANPDRAQAFVYPVPKTL